MTSIPEQAIDLFIEYRDRHGYDEQTAKAKVLCEFMDAEQEAAGPDVAGEYPFGPDIVVINALNAFLRMGLCPHGFTRDGIRKAMDAMGRTHGKARGEKEDSDGR